MKEVSINEAISRKYPEWITMVVSTDDNGNPNAMPVGWCMFTSHEPRMMAVSIGFERYTHNLLENGKEFVVSFPSKQQKEEVLYCGNNSGSDVDKFSETDLETTPASKVETPLIKESVACFECKKRGTLKTGDHRIFSGEIVAAHVSEESKEKIYTVENWYERGAGGFRAINEMM